MGSLRDLGIHDDWLVYFSEREPWFGDPFYPPQRVDVQVIARRKPKNEDGKPGLDHGKHYYVWRDGYWIGVDQGGKDDYLMTYLKPQSVLFGRTLVRDDDFWDIVGEAGRMRFPHAT